MPKLSLFLRNETYSRLSELVDKEKRKAQKVEDVEYLSELNRISQVLRTGGGIVRQPNAYIAFLEKCLPKEEGPKYSLKEAQEHFRGCVVKWNSMSKEEKERFRAQGLEVVNLP